MPKLPHFLKYPSVLLLLVVASVTLGQALQPLPGQKDAICDPTPLTVAAEVSHPDSGIHWVEVESSFCLEEGAYVQLTLITPEDMKIPLTNQREYMLAGDIVFNTRVIIPDFYEDKVYRVKLKAFDKRGNKLLAKVDPFDGNQPETACATNVLLVGNDTHFLLQGGGFVELTVTAFVPYDGGEFAIYIGKDGAVLDDGVDRSEVKLLNGDTTVGHLHEQFFTARIPFDDIPPVTAPVVFGCRKPAEAQDGEIYYFVLN